MTDDHLTDGGDGNTPVHADDLDGLRLKYISTQGEVDAAERNNVRQGRRWASLRRFSVHQLLNDNFVFQLNKRCFGDTYTWAGTRRVRQTSIGVDPILISTEMHNLLEDSRLWFATPQSDELVRRDLAVLHYRMMAIHPFPNGNGRTSRLHIRLMARALRIPLPTWGSGTENSRTTYLSAIRKADQGDYEPLAEFMWS